MNRTFLLLAGVVTLFAFGQPSARSVWDGVYSNEQAQRGETLYREQCASCHGAKLDGRGPTPPLAGKDFLNNWNGMTMKDLFDKVQTSMPADQPGRLTPQQNADILSFILRENQMPAGKAELTTETESLGKIRIDSASN